MGESVYKDEFSPEEYGEFSIRLEQQLTKLRELLNTESFNRETYSLGAELEIYLVNDHFLPAAVNEELLQMANHPQLTPELNRYNLEFNLSPVAAAGNPFEKMEKELRDFLETLQGHARSIDANIVPIGILPTLDQVHLNQSYMTDRPRYHALTRGLCGLRGNHYSININGKDPLSLHGEGVTVEGANTSFQVHLRIPANRFAAFFNATQLTTPLVLALAANSPLIAGHRLWQESRIALFKQSIDFRERQNPDWRQPARVTFGHGWLREGAWELFAENVALYQPIIPLLSEPDPGDPLALPELSLHHGTTWPWNRAVYSPLDGGHVRIEYRAMPAGPTVIDMMANAALAVGWTLGVADSIDHYMARLPFRFVEFNFYRAAQKGMAAKLIWPRKHVGGLEERPITELIEEFLPRAREGLGRIEVAGGDSDRLWQVIEQRLESRMNGASWQLKQFEHYRSTESVEKACSSMLADYVHNVMEGNPVASWC